MMRRTLSVTGLASLMLGLAAAPVSATFPGRNGDVAYRAIHGTDTTYRIYTREASGGPEEALTPDGKEAGDPTYTADGGRIVFTMESDIWVMWSDGTHKRNLTGSPMMEEGGVAVSPNGRWVAWFQGEGPSELWKMKLDGTEAQLVATAPGEGGSLSWSPNGNRFATYAYRNGSADLLLIDVQTGEKDWITNTLTWEDCPDWSPDGSRLVFSSGPQSGDRDLFTIKPDGTDRGRLTSTDEFDEIHPVWSPSGRKILFVQRIIASNSRDLAIMLAKKDAEQTLIGALVGDDFDPAWQPTEPEI